MKHQVEAYFYTAQDAEMAVKAINDTTASASEPVVVSPQNGRPFMITISLDTNNPSDLYPSPFLANLVTTLILRYHGATSITGGTRNG